MESYQRRYAEIIGRLKEVKKILIVEPKTVAVANNIALMKLARWCENKGHRYEYIVGCEKPNIIPDIIYMSCIFTYFADRYEKTIDYYLRMFPQADMIIGGVFPSINPTWFNKNKWLDNPFDKTSSRITLHKGMCDYIEDLVPKYSIGSGRSIVLYSSRGCPNKCGYCVVPRLEGRMRSFKSIKHILEAGLEEIPNAKSVCLYDNNFTAHKYFDTIVNELIDFNKPVDIHGLHVSAFTWEQAKQLAKLKWQGQGASDKPCPYIRFSFDKIKYGPDIEKAFKYYIDAGIKADFFLYLLFNWRDKPEDLWYRLQFCWNLAKKYNRAIQLFPQRYVPLTGKASLRQYDYVGKHWTQSLAYGVRRMATYLRGFFYIAPNRKIFRWIGHTEEEFIDNMREIGSTKNFKEFIKENWQGNQLQLPDGFEI